MAIRICLVSGRSASVNFDDQMTLGEASNIVGFFVSIILKMFHDACQSFSIFSFLKTTCFLDFLMFPFCDLAVTCWPRLFFERLLLELTIRGIETTKY